MMGLNGGATVGMATPPVTVVAGNDTCGKRHIGFNKRYADIYGTEQINIAAISPK